MTEASTPRFPAGWASMNQRERDLCYDNNAASSDSAALIDERNAASTAFRAAHPGALDIPYGDKPRQRFDLYPAKDAKAPCLVYIHGGYWQRNSREDFACFAEGMVAHGWSVAMPGYTLAPEVPLAAIVREIGLALDWLGAQGAAHGIAGPVILCGWSAGGQLTAMGLAHPLVKAGLAISGVFDLAPLKETYLDEKLRLTDAEIATLSPTRLPAVMKPLAIAYGTRELRALVEDSRCLHRLRADAHAPGALIPVAGANHFSIMNGLRKPDGELPRALLAMV